MFVSLRMRILQALHFPLEGAGTGHYVHNLSSYLVNRGHTVGVVHSQTPSSKNKSTPYMRFPVKFEYSIRASVKSASRLNFSFPVFESHPLSDGMTFEDLSDSEYDKYTLAFESEIRKAIDKIKPEVVNVHHGWVIGNLLAEKGIPYVVTLHGTELTAFKKYPDYRNLVLRGLHNAQSIIALNDVQRRQAIENYGLRPEDITVIYGGIDSSKFYMSSRVSRLQTLLSNKVDPEPQRSPVILYVGRLAPVKGVEFLVEAANHFKEHIEEVPKTLIVGDGILSKQLHTMKRDMNLSHVFLLGPRSPNQLLHLYNSADLVIVPSISEAFPLTPCESMACGTPIMGSNIEGGLDYQLSFLENLVRREMNVESNFSLRSEVGNSKSLARSVANTIQLNIKQNLRRSISEEASRLFSLDRLADDLLNAYTRVVG